MLFRKSSQRTLPILLALTLILAACNVGSTPAPTIDANAINTAAVATAMAQISGQQTQTALAAPSVTPLPTNTAIPLVTLSLPTASGAALPTANTGGQPTALPTVSFNSTPLPGITALSTVPPTLSGARPTTASGCNDGVMVGETLPDKSEVTAGETFSKAWEMKNTGTCNWDAGYIFTFLPDISSKDIVGRDVVINESDRLIKPGQSESFVVKIKAPTTPGEYKAYWKMQDDAGNFFGSQVWLDVIVK